MKEVKLNVVKFGLALAIVSALAMFATVLLSMSGYCLTCAELIEGIYGGLGVRISFVGAVLSGIYAFVDGFFLGLIFAWIYNKLL
jgi:hypothetical protein